MTVMGQDPVFALMVIQVWAMDDGQRTGQDDWKQKGLMAPTRIVLCLAASPASPNTSIREEQFSKGKGELYQQKRVRGTEYTNGTAVYDSTGRQVLQ